MATDYHYYYYYHYDYHYDYDYDYNYNYDNDYDYDYNTMFCCLPPVEQVKGRCKALTYNLSTGSSRARTGGSRQPAAKNSTVLFATCTTKQCKNSRARK